MTVVVADGGSDDTDKGLAHEVGEHDAKIENHETRLGQVETKVEDHVRQLADVPGMIASTAMAVPEEIWTRLKALEDRVEAVPDQIAETVDNLADDVQQDVAPVLVTPHKKTDPEPKVKSSNPILSLLRRF